MDPKWMETATRAATDVYRRFLDEVIIGHVVNDREKIVLGEKTRKKIEDGTYIDRRVLRLMSFSGKGGYSPDPEKQQIYDRFHNVTLLDHLLSVTRGAVTLAALDWLNQNPDMDASLLNRRLSIIAAIGFMHDVDKDCKLPRNTPVEIKHVAERMARYGIEGFLANAGASLSPDQLRYLIEKVEATQSHRHAPEKMPPAEFESLPLYVRLADQLDGTWLLSDAEKGGIAGVLKSLEKDQGCLRSDILKHWKAVRLFDPHHLFLLDELQRYLSLHSFRLTGILPLFEVHQDGHLFMLLPEHGYDEITAKALTSLCNSLPFKLYLNVSTPGVPSLYSGQPDHEELEKFVKDLKPKDFSNLFKIKRELKDALKDPLDEILADIGLQPRWQEKGTTQLITLYANLDTIEDPDKEWLYRAAHLVLLLNLKVDAKPKDGIPGYPEREAELLQSVDTERPEWLEKIEFDASRRTLTGLWVTAMAEQNEEILETVWGDEGLLKKWLEGDENGPGFNKFITGEGTAILAGVKQRFHDILSGRRVQVADEKAKGRCIFTDEPVPFGETISQALGLYGVKVSAFSGRDNRPELLTSENSHTNVGPSSVAEHKMRSAVHEKQGGKDNGVPTLISSPTTSGLFGGLGMTDDRMMGAMSLYDLNRMEIKKGNVLRNVEMYRNRFRMARLERIPEKLKEQVNTLEMILKSVRRIGRPLHLFRGLPRLEKSFFYYDAMPGVLRNLLGGNSLHLEQIPQALDRLITAKMLLEARGLGYEVLKLYAVPDTRFGALCLACAYLRDHEDEAKKSGDSLRDLNRECLTYMEGKIAMNENDGALVKLGEAVAGIQRGPRGGASGSEELLGFKICLDTMNRARRDKITDKKSLVYAIAGELETNLVRKVKASAKESREGKTLREGCLDVAEIFVNDVWLGVLGGKPPGQTSRRVLSSIYRIAFLKAHGEFVKQKKSSENNA